MSKKLYILSLMCCVLGVCGCVQITETAKVIWGSSTRALEEARVDAISKTYRCSFNNCYDAVMDLARVEDKPSPFDEEDAEAAEPAPKAIKSGYFDIFINNRKKGHLVVMGISGNIDTTEVGIFFTQPTLTTVKIEVASLSNSAKRKVAQLVFEELTAKFSEVQ